MPMRKLQGFTLIEMLVVVALVAILASLAAPGFNSMIASRSVASAASAMADDYRFARSEAIKRGGYVTLCRSLDAAACTTDVGSWHTGWLVFSDYNGNGALDAGSDTVLRVQQSVSGVSALAHPTVSSTPVKATFRPNGLGVAINTSWVVTPINSSATNSTRLLCVSTNGRVALRDAGDSSC